MADNSNSNLVRDSPERKDRLDPKKKYTYLSILLYPDCEAHVSAIQFITNQTEFKYSFILHDRDGVKPHYHVLVKFSHPRYHRSFAKSLGIEDRFLGRVDNPQGAREYFLHLNDPKKFQYSLDDVQGDFSAFDKSSSDLIKKFDESNVILSMFSFFDEHPDEIVTTRQFAEWVCSNGLWSFYRRSASIFSSILREHNDSIRFAAQKAVERELLRSQALDAGTSFETANFTTLVNFFERKDNHQ